VAWGNNLFRIGASYTLIPLVVGFYGYGLLRNDAKPREVGVLGAEALLDGLIVVQVLKPITGRNRPDSAGEKGPFFHGGDSFPSGHVIESWALASVIAHEYGHGHSKLVPILAYGLAGIVSTARFTAQKHYASDIVVGGVMGCLSAVTFTRRTWTTPFITTLGCSRGLCRSSNHLSGYMELH
jgi:membrane-associated phospholipid phosphatase